MSFARYIGTLLPRGGTVDTPEGSRPVAVFRAGSGLAESRRQWTVGECSGPCRCFTADSASGSTSASVAKCVSASATQ